MFLTGASLAAVSVWKTVETEGLVFCISQDCIDFAKSKFASALWLFKITTDFCVATATVLAGYYALRTYMDSVDARKRAQAVEHFRNFCSVIDSAPFDVRLKLSVNSKEKLYKFLFPNAFSGDLNVSQEYVDSLRSLCSLLDAASKSYGLGNFDKRAHSKLVLEKFASLEIQFPDYREADHYSHEARACGFFDYINSTVHGVTIRLSSERHYKAD